MEHLPIILADFDPGTLTGFFIALLFGVVFGGCLIFAGVMSLMKKQKIARELLTAAGICFAIGAVLLFLALSLGKELHLP